MSWRRWDSLIMGDPQEQALIAAILNPVESPLDGQDIPGFLMVMILKPIHDICTGKNIRP